jgi:hypothetical protein
MRTLTCATSVEFWADAGVSKSNGTGRLEDEYEL